MDRQSLNYDMCGYRSVPTTCANITPAKGRLPTLRRQVLYYNLLVISLDLWRGNLWSLQKVVAP